MINQSKYHYKLNLLSIIAISLSSMLGSGIFVLPGLAYNLTGNSLYLAYLIAGFAIFPSALTKSELASAMPCNGGTYVYLERTFGPFVGTLTGLGLWLSLLLKSSFALIGLGAYFTIFFNFNIKYVSISLLILITILNILGTAKISKIINFIILISIVSILVISFIAFNSNISISSNHPFLQNGFYGFMDAVSFVFISYAGVTKIAAIADEVDNPSKNIPKGIIISLLIATFLYSLISYILTMIIPSQQLSGNLKTFYDLAHILLTPTVASIFAIVAIITMSSMANSGILAASKFPYAMSKDHLLPSLFQKTSLRFKTPYFALLITAFACAIFILFFPINKTAKLASGFLLFIYMIEHIALIILKEMRIKWYSPDYKSPFYPYGQFIGIIICIILLVKMGVFMLYGIISISIPGILLFIFYSRKKVERKGVLGIRGFRNDLLQSKPCIQNKKVKIKIDKKKKHDVSVILLGLEISAEALCELGFILSSSDEIEVKYISEVPESISIHSETEKDLEIGAMEKSISRRLQAMSAIMKKGIDFETIYTHDLVATIFNISQEKKTNWIILEGSSRKQGFLTFANPLASIRNSLASNLAFYNNKGIRYIKNILIYYKAGDHFEFILKTSLFISKLYNAKLSIITFNDEFKTEKYLSNFLNTKDSEFIKIVNLKENKSHASAILKISVEYDLLILETINKNLWHTFFSQENKIMKFCSCNVLAIKAKKID